MGEITGRTRLVCLLGSPIEHSLSPQMHNTSFQDRGLDYSYMAFEVKEENLSKVIDAFKIMNVRGVNLTMPLKNSIVPLCDRLSPAAELSGAVNTVVFEDDGTMTGHTTDGAGFLLALKEENIEYKGKKIVLFGTGGAGTAILVQAALDGAREISVFIRENSRFRPRTEECIKNLNDRTDCKLSLHFYSDAEMKKELSDADVLINASNVGMSPNEDGCLIPDASFFHEGLAVTDVIYNPKKTKLLKMAEERGLKTMNGMYMLLYQGAEAFKLWTGVDMPVELVKEKYFKNK